MKFKEVSGKLSSAIMKRNVGRTDTSSKEWLILYVKDGRMNKDVGVCL